MKNYQKIKIDNNEFYIIDSIQNLRAEDSFIFRKNKLEAHRGNGEARKYVGSYLGPSGDRLSDFFEYSNWGEGKKEGKRIYQTIQEKCFFSKSNLLKYLYDSRIEYQKQEQVYKYDISNLYQTHIDTIRTLPKDKIFFSIYDVSDFKENKLSRGYIRSDDNIWDLWRKLVLPKISYLSILKLVPVDTNTSSASPLFYFRILLDYQFRSIVHPKLSSLEQGVLSIKQEPHKKTKSNVRIGQPKFKKGVHEHMPQCPFTKISDERLLTASHIKPYSVCVSEQNTKQALDYLNGLTLSPTYDRLFDQGYITFTDNGELICGTQISNYTWEKLNINPNAKNILRIYPENRGEYLDFHRRFVFQDDVSDLM